MARLLEDGVVSLELESGRGGASNTTDPDDSDDCSATSSDAGGASPKSSEQACDNPAIMVVLICSICTMANLNVRTRSFMLTSVGPGFFSTFWSCGLVMMHVFSKGSCAQMPWLVSWATLEGVSLASVVAVYVAANKCREMVFAAALTLGILALCMTLRIRCKKSDNGAATILCYLKYLTCIYLAWRFYNLEKLQEPSFWISSCGIVIGGMYLWLHKGDMHLHGHSIFALVTLYINILNLWPRVTAPEQGYMNYDTVRTTTDLNNAIYFLQTLY